MERDVGVVVLALLDPSVALCHRRLHRVEALLEPRDLLRRRALRREARGRDLDHAPALQVVAEQRHRGRAAERGLDHVGVEEVPLLARVDDRRAAVLDGHQPALLEAAHRLAGDAPADVELLGERVSFGSRVPGASVPDTIASTNSSIVSRCRRIRK